MWCQSSDGSDFVLTGQQPIPVVIDGCLNNRRELCRKFELSANTGAADVMCRMLSEMSLPGVLNLLNGSFSGICMDESRGEFYLFRDHLGQKSLFYALTADGNCYFSNRLDYLISMPGVDLSIDLEALGNYFALGYIASPRTIYCGIRKVMAGYFVRISRTADLISRRYWQPNFIPKRNISFSEAIEETRGNLERAIGRCLDNYSDASFMLSGGVDSAVAASLLKNEYEVIGVTLQMQGGCFALKDIDKSLGMRLFVLCFFAIDLSFIFDAVYCAVKSVEKTDPKERVGVFCRKNKKVGVITNLN